MNVVRQIRISLSITLLLSALQVAADIRFETHRIETEFVLRQPVMVARMGTSDVAVAVPVKVPVKAPVKAPVKVPVKAPVPATPNVAVETPVIVLAGDDARHRQWIALYRFQPTNSERDEAGNRQNGESAFEKIDSFQVPPEFLYYDIGSFGCWRRANCPEGIYFLTPEGLSVWNLATRSFDRVLAIPSLYHQVRTGRLRYQDFLKDLNGDGLGDLLVPDVLGYRIRLQGADNSDMLLSGGVQMKLSDDAVRYVNRPLYASDLNFDNRQDLFYLRDHILHGFLQRSSGSYASEEIQRQIPLDFLSEARREEIEESRGEIDQSDLVFKQIASIEDINADGILDIATDATVSKGLFDKHSEFDVYYGRNAEGWLGYAPVADTGVDSQGVQLNVQLVDLDGDERRDLVTTTIRISLMKVVGALFSGSIGVKFSFYRLGEDGHYPKVPDYRSYARMAFDLKTGHVKIPALVLADFNGDGRKDLLLQHSETAMSFYAGVPEKRLFSAKDSRIQMDLPANGERVQSEDVNGDGLSDLILRYDASDSEEKARSVTLMLAHPAD